MDINNFFLKSNFKQKVVHVAFASVSECIISTGLVYIYIPSFVHSFNIPPRLKRTNLKPSFLELLIDFIVSQEDDKTLTGEKNLKSISGKEFNLFTKERPNKT